MNKEEFAQDPWSVHEQGHDLRTVPSEWVSYAWSVNADFRDVLVEGLVRSIDKLGVFDLANDYVELIAPALDRGQFNQLYVDLRDATGRNEIEWRCEFEQAFPATSGQLPPAKRESLDRYDYAKGLLGAIHEQKVATVAWLIRCLEDAGLDIRSQTIADLAKLGISAREAATMDRARFQELVARTPSAAIQLSEFARRVGNHEIIHLLEQAESKSRPELR